MSVVKKAYRRLVADELKAVEQEPDIEEWSAFLKTLPRAVDCIDRSYNKFLCRRRHLSALKMLLLNAISSIVLIPITACLIFARPLQAVPDARTVLIERRDDLGFDDILPTSFVGSFDNCKVTSEYKRQLGAMCSPARALFLRAWKKHPFSPYYLHYVAKELIKHSTYLLEFNPEASLVYINERNIACSVLRELYESTDRKFCSFMHGHYLLQPIQAYTDFSEFYIWDERYEEQFANYLHCNIGLYVTYTPEKLRKKWRLEEIEPEYEFTYYFSGESRESVLRVMEIAKSLESRGRKFKVRSHPRYSHSELIKSLSDGITVEDPRLVPLRDSLALTRYAVGLESTVLYEAAIEGRQVVIDDMSNPSKYFNLRARRCLLLEDEHALLSSFL